MKIVDVEFRPGGIWLKFENESEVIGTFTVRDNIMYMDGLTKPQQQALTAFNSSMDESALLDPRLDFCRPDAGTGSTGDTEQDILIGNSLLQWSRVDSITGVLEGEPVIYWPSLTGEDGLATNVDESDIYTGGGRYRANFLNGKPVIETSSNPTIEGASLFDDFNGLNIGHKPVMVFFVTRLKTLSSSGVLMSDTDPSDGNTNGLIIQYQGGSFGWKVSHWGEGKLLVGRTFAPTDTNWHVYATQIGEAPNRVIKFWDGIVQQTPIGSITQAANFPITTTGLRVFGLGATIDPVYRGQLAEFRVYEGIMSDEDREAITNALIARFDI
jgi:hypothetical protein